MHLLYVFPEPLPLPRARGVQVVHALAALAEVIAAQSGGRITLAYVPLADSPDPFAAYGLQKPANIELLPMSRGLPWPLSGLRAHSNSLFVGRLGRWIRAANRAGRGPDLILVRHVKLGAALVRDFPAIPLAYEAHEVFADTAAGHRRDKIFALEQALVRGAVLLLANSRATAERLHALHQPTRPVHVLPNGVHLPPQQPVKDWRRLQQSVIYAGSLFGWKGVEDLVAASAHLPGWRITIVGGSPEQVARLQAQAPSEGAELVFRGHRPHGETKALVEQACVAVLPNRADPDSAFTSPLKLFEYMAAGCAVVATRLPSVEEILGADMATWAEPGDPASLAAALTALAADPQQAQARADRAYGHVQQFSWHARAETLHQLLLATLEGHPP